MMKHDPKQLQALLATTVPDLELAFRPMFGGILAYHAGRPVASLSDMGLALKLAGVDHAALLAVPGAVALRYEPDSAPSKSYVVIPPAMLTDTDTLRGWVVRAVAGLAAPKVKKK